MWSIAWRWKGSIFLGAMAAAVATFVGLAQVTPTYEARTQVILGSGASQIINIPNVVPETIANGAYSESALIVIRSNDVLRAVARDLKLNELPEFNPALRDPTTLEVFKSWLGNLIPVAARDPAENTVSFPEMADDPLAGTLRSLRAAVAAKVLGESYVIEVTARSSNPRLAATISDTIAQTYISRQLETKLRAGGEATEWLEERATELRQDLARSENRVADYRSNLINSGQEMADDFAPQLAELTTQIARLSTELSDLAARRDEIAKLFTTENYVALTETLAVPAVTALFDRLTELDNRLFELNAQFGDHPGIKQATEARAFVHAQLTEQIERALSGMDVRVGIIAQRLEALKTDLQSTRRAMGDRRQAELTLLELERDAATSRDVYNRFLLRLKEARERSLFQSPEASIVSNAEVPLYPVAPEKTKLAAIAGVGGGLIVLVIAALAGMLNTRIKDPQEAAGLTGAPAHQIPLVRGAEAPVDLLRQMRSTTGTTLAGAVYWLRLRLLPKNARKAKIIVVTSAGQGEGKSTLSLLLAEAFDADGYATLLVNADPARGGLSDLATSQEYEEASFQFLDYSDDAMRMMERQSGFEVSLSERLNAMRRTDVIIIDGPAALASPEFIEFGLLADALVLACVWNRTTPQSLKQCVDVLQDAGVHISAVAINQVPERIMATIGATTPTVRRPRALPPPSSTSS